MHLDNYGLFNSQEEELMDWCKNVDALSCFYPIKSSRYKNLQHLIKDPSPFYHLSSLSFALCNCQFILQCLSDGFQIQRPLDYLPGLTPMCFKQMQPILKLKEKYTFAFSELFFYIYFTTMHKPNVLCSNLNGNLNIIIQIKLSLL